MHTRKWFFAAAGMTLSALAVTAGIRIAEAQGAAPAAGPQLYTVEIVVFRTRQPLGVAEDWSTPGMLVQPSEDDTDGVAGAPGASRTVIQPLSSAQFKLAGTDAALRRSANYQVLAHVAWTQAATPRGGSTGASLAELGVNDSTLRGTVALEQGRYLHLNFDLAWTPTDPPSSLLAVTGATTPVTFTLKQKRRVRAFEQHYFDHPAFGVIAIISPAN